MLAVTLATFAAAGQAQAACTVDGSASSSASKSVVDCTGTTTNTGSDGHDGYGSANDTGNAYTVHSGASVTGDDNGIRLGGDGTFTVDGTVTGGNDFGILGRAPTVTNSGTISGRTAGLATAGTLNLIGNTGTITGVVSGIELDGPSATINNANTISATGAAGAGIDAAGIRAIENQTLKINTAGENRAITGKTVRIKALHTETNAPRTHST